MVVVNRPIFRELLKIGHGTAPVAVQRDMTLRPGVEHQKDDVGVGRSCSLHQAAQRV